MKKPLILFTMILLCLSGCAKETVDKPDGNNPIQQPEVDNQKEEIEDYTVEFKTRYNTDNVYVDALNPLSYLVITDNEVILITKIQDIENISIIEKKAITSIEASTVVTYSTITILTTNSTQQYTFTAENDFEEIMNNLK